MLLVTLQRAPEADADPKALMVCKGPVVLPSPTFRRDREADADGEVLMACVGPVV